MCFIPFLKSQNVLENQLVDESEFSISDNRIINPDDFDENIVSNPDRFENFILDNLLNSFTGEYFCGIEYIDKPEIDCKNAFCTTRCPFPKGIYCAQGREDSYCECNENEGASVYRQCGTGLVYDPKAGVCLPKFAMIDPSRNDCKFSGNIAVLEVDNEKSASPNVIGNVTDW